MEPNSQISHHAPAANEIRTNEQATGVKGHQGVKSLKAQIEQPLPDALVKRPLMRVMSAPVFVLEHTTSELSSLLIREALACN